MGVLDVLSNAGLGHTGGSSLVMSLPAPSWLFLFPKSHRARSGLTPLVFNPGLTHGSGDTAEAELLWQEGHPRPLE